MKQKQVARQMQAKNKQPLKVQYSGSVKKGKDNLNKNQQRTKGAMPSPSKKKGGNYSRQQPVQEVVCEDDEENEVMEEEEEEEYSEEEAQMPSPVHRGGKNAQAAGGGVKNGFSRVQQEMSDEEEQSEEEEAEEECEGEYEKQSYEDDEAAEEESDEEGEGEEEDEEEAYEGQEQEQAEVESDEERHEGEMASDQEQYEEEAEEEEYMDAEEEDMNEQQAEYDDDDNEEDLGEENGDDNDEDNNDNDADGDEGEEEELEEEEEVGDEESDDDTPIALPITKTPKIQDLPIPANYPKGRVIHVRKISPSATRMDVIESFGQFGQLTYVHLSETKWNFLAADIAYNDDQSVKEVFEIEGGSVMVKGEPVEVYLKRPDQSLTNAQKHQDAMKSQERTVHVNGLNVRLNEDMIKSHFAGCGEIEKINLFRKKTIAFAFVTYKSKEMAVEALKMHNTVLAGNTITVKACVNKEDITPPQRDPKRTIALRNSMDLKGIEGSLLESIFSKCGEIESMDVICRKSALAFITFTNEEAVEEAHKLNGTTENGLLLEVASYNPDMAKTSVFVSNVGKGVTEDDLLKLFSKCGEVASVKLKRGFAIVNFKEPEGFCKSFLLNESIVKNQMIFLEPHSIKKQAILSHQKKAIKRPYNQYHHQKKNKNFKFQSNGMGGGGGAKRSKMSNNNE